MQSNQTCSICQRQPQDLLVLVCGHNLCVTCATQIYTLNGSANPFICQICLVQTQLDNDTIAHFQSATQRNYGHKNSYQNKLEMRVTDKKQKQRQKERDKDKQKISKPPKSKSPQKKYNSADKNYCKIHNQPALYYCYNCNTVQICSQCILTPKHNTHKVLTLKKALLSLQSHLQQQTKTLQLIKSQISQQKQYLILKKTQCMKSYTSKKSEIKQIFDEIAQTVSDKYAELCLKIQQQSNKSTTIYQAYIAQLDEKYKVIEETIKMQIKASKEQSQMLLVQYMPGLNDAKMFAVANLPKQLPHCRLQLINPQSLSYQLCQLLSRFHFSIYSDTSQTQSQIDYSIIHQQNLQQPQQPKTILKQSCKRSINGASNNLNSNNLNRSYNRVGSSRKLELSRSIQNATYIINKLQQRSKAN